MENDPSKLEHEVEQLRRRLSILEQNQRPRAQPKLRLGTLVLGVAVIGSAAWAQLTTFTPNSPAVASQVNGNFTQLKTWLETKVGTVASNSISASGLSMNGAQIKSVGAPTADTDVVTKAHLKALFSGMVIYVAGSSCPLGFSPYANAESRFPLGAANGDQSTGGASTMYIATSQQQAAGSGYSKTSAVALLTDVSAAVWSNSDSEVYNPFTYRQSAGIDIRPRWVVLKPCIFNSSY